MKFLGAVAITSLFATSFAAPAPVAKRTCADATNSALEPQADSIVQSLSSNLAPFFSAINDAHTAFQSSGDAATATTAYTSAIGSIGSNIDDAATQVTALTGVSNDDVKTQYADCISELTLSSVALKKRQGSLITDLQAVIQELLTAVQTIVADLGLTATLSFLNPLLASLGGLLLSLIPVVNNLLALVQNLLDSLLTGLGLGLAGLVL